MLLGVTSPLHYQVVAVALLTRRLVAHATGLVGVTCALCRSVPSLPSVRATNWRVPTSRLSMRVLPEVNDLWQPCKRLLGRLRSVDVPRAVHCFAATVRIRPQACSVGRAFCREYLDVRLLYVSTGASTARTANSDTGMETVR